MVVFLGISLEKTPPSVSMPKLSGVTSSSNKSCTSPFSTPPWIAAPYATASSGFTEVFSFLPSKNSDTFLCTSGILVEPPTIMHSSNSDFFNPESLIQFSIGLIDLTIKSSIKLSNLALVRFMNMFFGPCCVIVIYGKLIDV